MAQITINEISQNYSYNVGTNSFATVALPITACWGPAIMDPATLGDDITIDDILEEAAFTRFPSTQEGLESFVSTYRGPATNYRLAKDYSYQMAMTLITSGYDVLVCRLCPGTMAKTVFNSMDLLKEAPEDFTTNYSNYYKYDKSGNLVALTSQEEFVADTYYKLNDSNNLEVTAKYPGTFGNNLRVSFAKVPNRNYFNLITYVVDTSGVQTAVENLIFTLDVDHSTDNILYIDEVESNFLTLKVNGALDDTSTFDKAVTLLSGGTDKSDDTNVQTAIDSAKELARTRYNLAGYDTADGLYETTLASRTPADTDIAQANTLKYNEWLYTYTWYALELLEDKLTYNPQRIILPGWDDQNINAISASGEPNTDAFTQISPLHIRLMEVAYYSRCATSLLDIPKSLPRKYVYDEGSTTGYAQMLSRYVPSTSTYDVNSSLYSTHSGLFAPWRQYTYVGTSKQNDAPPAFLSLIINRAMILNQTLQYEWALPTNRQHNLNIGKADYKVPKKLLDSWQTLEGVGVNVITEIPDLGVTQWGNSTLYEVPPATYQALANLSTRFLVNAVEDVAYRCGISITFQYNNEQAYNKFYAGVTPTLDTMKNVGAIDDYYVRMSADINGLDQVNANSVIGKIYLVVNGVINDITIDLIALPPGTDLNQYRS